MATGRDRSQPALGVAFPEVDGTRSSSRAARAVLAAAARPADPALAEDIEQERDWRQRYGLYVRRLVEAELRAEVDAGAVPRAGLDELYRQLEFVRGERTVPLAEASALPSSGRLRTATIEGRKPAGSLEVPYRGERLYNDDLIRQLDRWVDAGTVEPSFADAIGRLITHPEWLDLSRFTIVVLGAGAELGPMRMLCRWGATVVPVDLPRPGLWERLLRLVRAGTGRAIIPLHRPVGRGADDRAIAAAAGVDLTTAIPELARWLRSLQGPLVLGCYAYADGADHVRVSMAADAIALSLLHHAEDISLAGLLSPTDVFAVPEPVVTASQSRFDAGGVVPRLGRALSLGRGFVPNYTGKVTIRDGTRYGIADAIIVQQGPNYALAKRLQGWRLRLARHEGVRVSVNVAPATRTRSVTSNRLLAAAYAGAPRFGIEVFEPNTASTLMAALLAHDLHRPPATPAPGTPGPHELELFSDAACHGGLWRNPYAPGSVLPMAAVLGLPRAR